MIDALEDILTAGAFAISIGFIVYAFVTLGGF